MDRKRRVLTFPNFKFCTDYSVPGGSVDWDRVPRDLRTQVAFVAGEALRELREESGIALSLARCSGSPCPSHAPPGSCAFCEHQKVF